MILYGVLMLAFILATPRPPDITSPPEIAQWAGCDVGKVSWFVAQSIDYKVTKGWEVASTCLERKTGDCKCYAVANKEILDNCNGWTNRLVTIRRPIGNGNYSYHAVTVFVDHKGNKGYINGRYYKIYDPDKDLGEMLKEIEGGPWEYVHG